MSKSGKHSNELTDPDPSGQEKNSLRGRRKLIKRLAGGGGLMVTGAYLPEKWGSPVVHSVLLPAHAETSPPETPVMSCSITVCEGTGGQSPCETYTSDATISLGCFDDSDSFGVDIGGESGPGNYPDICTTVTQAGVGIPGLTVQLDVTLSAGFFGGGGFDGTDQRMTDANGVACGFDFGGGNDLFNVDTGKNALFCFSVLNRPDIAPCCIRLTWDCED